jgi:CBS domain-containing protein
MHVSELCTQKVETAAPDTRAQEAARLMARTGVGTLVIVDDLRRPLGILTDRDVMARIVAEDLSSRNTRVSEVMSGPVAWIHAERPLDDALEEMARLRVRRLAVVDSRERLVGVLALDDVLLAALEEGSLLRAALQATV